MLNDKNFINIASEIALGSKCISIWVWTIIVKDNRILSTGYNWTPSWYINCNNYMKDKTREIHHEWSLKHEIHAEMNALLWAARNWVKIEWATIYCTHQPCYECTKNIISSWIKTIIYKEKFKHNSWEESEIFMKDNNCSIYQIKD